jgi:hypothetical protein
VQRNAHNTWALRGWTIALVAAALDLVILGELARLYGGLVGDTLDAATTAAALIVGAWVGIAVDSRRRARGIETDRERRLRGDSKRNSNRR